MQPIPTNNLKKIQHGGVGAGRGRVGASKNACLVNSWRTEAELALLCLIPCSLRVSPGTVAADRKPQRPREGLHSKRVSFALFIDLENVR